MDSVKVFVADEDGLVTIDWVVLAAGLVAIAFAVMAVTSGGLGSLSIEMRDDLLAMEAGTISFEQGPETVAFSGAMAADYLAYGASLAPGNNGATYAHAQEAAALDAPAGYNFDNPLMDSDSGNVIYTSDDGTSYAVGGEVYAIADFPGTVVSFTA